MSTFRVLPSDPSKRKAWAAKVAKDYVQDQYFSRMMGPEGSDAVIVRKTDLEGEGAGDEVTTTLVARLRGSPVQEGQKLEGREKKFSSTVHTMRINEFRDAVNLGAKIDQQRVGFNIRSQGRNKLTTLLKEQMEQLGLMTLSGARGVGVEIDHYPTSYAGYPNAFRAPDAGHLFVGADGTKAKATLATTDKVTLDTISRLKTKAKTMTTGQEGTGVKLQETTKGGMRGYILAVCPEVMADVRRDTGASGWIEAQKALTAKIGKDAEWFKGGAGMFDGVIVDEMPIAVKFDDYGSGANVPAVRSLFLGANAGCFANGTKGLPDNMEVKLSESTADHDHEAILHYLTICGWDKTQFDGKDYGMFSVDTAYTATV